MRTGQVAKEAGVSVEALRLYERRGLLEEPQRRASSGYREYPLEAVGVVRFIKNAQGLGFTLREVGELLRLRDRERGSRSDVRAAARNKLEDVERKIRSLRAIKRALSALVKSCSGDGTARECPILRALAPTAKDPMAAGRPMSRRR